MKAPTRIVALLSVLFLCGICFSAWSVSEGRFAWEVQFSPHIVVMALAICQTCLLALWGVFSQNRPWIRALGMSFGIVYLETLVRFGVQRNEFSAMPTIVTISTATALFYFRIRDVELRRFSHQPGPTQTQSIQYSMRGLLAFMTLVAVVIVAANGLRESSASRLSVLALPIWSLFCVITNLVFIWAILGSGKVMFRSAVAILVSITLGAIFSYMIAHYWIIVFYIMSITEIQTLLLLGSLFVIRSSGYRFEPCDFPSDAGGAVD